MRKPVRMPWGKKLEITLIRMVIATAILLMLSQILPVGSSFKQASVPANSLEQVRPHIKNQDVSQYPVVTLQLKNFSSLPHAKVLVNGEAKGEFKNRYVTVFVQEGDVLEVDSTRYNRPLDIEVLDVSKGVLLPVAGTRIRVDGCIGTLGQVRLHDVE